MSNEEYVEEDLLDDDIDYEDDDIDYEEDEIYYEDEDFEDFSDDNSDYGEYDGDLDETDGENGSDGDYVISSGISPKNNGETSDPNFFDRTSIDENALGNNENFARADFEKSDESEKISSVNEVGVFSYGKGQGGSISEDLDMGSESEKPNWVSDLNEDFTNILSSVQYTRTLTEIPVTSLVLSEAHKQTRINTSIGLTASIGSIQRVLVPIDVIKLASHGDEMELYQLVHGIRRVYGAVKNGFQTVPAYVWEFEDREKGTELAFLLGLIINRQQQHDYQETWNAMKSLEISYDMRPSQIERLFPNLGSGGAMKLKDVALGEYDEPRNELFEGNKTLDQAYRLLQKLRKEEDSLAVDDMTSVLSENELAKDVMVEGNAPQSNILTDQEVRDLLELHTNLDLEDLDDSRFSEKLIEDMHQDRKSTDGYRDMPHELKMKIKVRDGMVCQCCSKGHPENAPAFVSQLEVHHIVPVHSGGTDIEENLITLCVRCHRSVHIMEKEGRILTTKEQFEKMTDDQQRIVLNAYDFARTAIRAAQMKGLSHAQRIEGASKSMKNSFPTVDLKEDRTILSAMN